MTEKLIIRVDASSLKESSCSRRFYLNVIEGYRTRVNSNDIEFGSAVHEFIKIMRTSGGNYALAIKAAQERYAVPMEFKDRKQYMTPTYLTRVCMDFWQNWVEKDDFETIIKDGEPLVELKFSYPYYADDQVEVLLCGTIDDICKHKHGTYALRDYKTTSVYDKTGYLAGYALSPQLMFYKMIIDYYGRSYPDSLFGELSQKNIACFIDGIFLAGAAKPADFARSEIFVFKPEQMTEFEKLVNTAVMKLVADVKANLLPTREGMLNGACQTVYGKCKYFTACLQGDETGMQHMLNRHFIKAEYNPLKFGEEHSKK
jgi:hypothetical protein